MAQKKIAVFDVPAEPHPLCTPDWMTVYQEKLLKRPDTFEYASTPPTFPLFVPAAPAAAASSSQAGDDQEKEDASFIVPVGSAAKTTVFSLDPRITFLNHGSYGATLMICQQAQQYYRQLMERNGPGFMEYEVLPGVHATQLALSKMVKCPVNDLVLVPNASTGTSTVLRCLQNRPGSKAGQEGGGAEGGERKIILLFSMSYNAVKNQVAQLFDERGSAFTPMVMQVELFPFNPAVFLTKLEALLKEYQSRIAVVLVDHIVSMPGLVMPLQAMIELVHKYHLLVLVDGAHALGNIAIDLTALQPDFYTSNCHKWLCSPKGTAFLYVHPTHQSWIRPLCMSHGCGQGFGAEFGWLGTLDYTGWMATKQAVDFFTAVGAEKIMKRNTNLARWAAAMLSEYWKTELVVPLELTNSMATIFLPPGKYSKGKDGPQAGALHQQLQLQYHLEVPIAAFGDRCVLVVSLCLCVFVSFFFLSSLLLFFSFVCQPFSSLSLARCSRCCC